MIRVLSQKVAAFGLVVVIDEKFDVLYRAWCVAEIVEASLLNIPTKIKACKFMFFFLLVLLEVFTRFRILYGAKGGYRCFFGYLFGTRIPIKPAFMLLKKKNN